MIIVTGSREFKDRSIVDKSLDLFLQQQRRVTLVVGDCPTGADLFARDWAQRAIVLHNADVTIKMFEANWDRKCDEKCYHPPKFKPVRNVMDPSGPEILVRYCPIAGHVRNQEMVDWIVAQDISADCLAFFRFGAKNKGTRDCVMRSKKAKFHIYKYIDWGRNG